MGDGPYRFAGEVVDVSGEPVGEQRLVDEHGGIRGNVDGPAVQVEVDLLGPLGGGGADEVGGGLLDALPDADEGQPPPGRAEFDAFGLEYRVVEDRGEVQPRRELGEHRLRGGGNGEGGKVLATVLDDTALPLHLTVEFGLVGLGALDEHFEREARVAAPGGEFLGGVGEFPVEVAEQAPGDGGQLPAVGQAVPLVTDRLAQRGEAFGGNLRAQFPQPLVPAQRARP